MILAQFDQFCHQVGWFIGGRQTASEECKQSAICFILWECDQSVKPLDSDSSPIIQSKITAPSHRFGQTSWPRSGADVKIFRHDCVFDREFVTGRESPLQE